MNWILGVITITLTILFFLYNRRVNVSEDVEHDRRALELEEIDLGDYPHE